MFELRPQIIFSRFEAKNQTSFFLDTLIVFKWTVKFYVRNVKYIWLSFILSPIFWAIESKAA